MDKPKDFNYFMRNREGIPYRDWPKDIKDYKNYLRRKYRNPELAELSDDDRKLKHDEKRRLNLEKARVIVLSYDPEQLKELNKRKTRHIREMSPEQKRIQSEKMSAGCRNFWEGMTPEERSNFARTRLNWENMSQDEQCTIINRLVTGNKSWWKSLSSEEQLYRISLMNEGFRKKCEEEPGFYDYCIQTLRQNSENYVNNLTDEDRAKIGERMKIVWRNLPEEKKIAHAERRRQLNHEYWNSLTDAERRRLSENKSNWWKKLSDKERFEWFLKRSAAQASANMNPKETEEIFHNLLIRYDVPCELQYYNKLEHPNFKKIFKIHPITGSKNISPFHRWDFLVHTPTGDMLIDIDGSMHNQKKPFIIKDNNFDVKKSNAFNDSQRPYQTDGLPAYIVLAYNDKLDMETPVISLKYPDDKMNVKQLLAILTFDPKNYKGLKN